MAARTNNTPLWIQLEELANRQTMIFEQIKSLEQDLNGLDPLIEKLTDIAVKTNTLTDLITKIDIRKLEQAIVQLNDKIPSIDPLIKSLEVVIKNINGLANELGVSNDN